MSLFKDAEQAAQQYIRTTEATHLSNRDRLTCVYETIDGLRTKGLHANDVHILKPAGLVARVLKKERLIDFPYAEPEAGPLIVAHHMLGWIIPRVVTPSSSSVSKEASSLLVLTDGQAAVATSQHTCWAELNNAKGQLIIPAERLEPLETLQQSVDLQQVCRVLGSWLTEAQTQG